MQTPYGQFRSPVGAFEFMRDFAPVDTPVPARDYSALRVGQLDSWSSLQTPMVPVALEGLPASSSGLVNYSPLAPMFTFGQQMVNERAQFIREISDNRRQFQRRKQIMYDGMKRARKLQDDRFQYVAPGTAEAEFIERMLQANRDTGTGLPPTGISFEQDRM